MTTILSEVLAQAKSISYVQPNPQTNLNQTATVTASNYESMICKGNGSPQGYVRWLLEPMTAQCAARATASNLKKGKIISKSTKLQASFFPAVEKNTVCS